MLTGGAYLRHGWSPGLLEYPLFFPAGQLPAGYGFGLPVVYAIWAASLVALYLACRWFARVKQRRRLRKTYERWAAAWADLVPRRRPRS